MSRALGAALLLLLLGPAGEGQTLSGEWSTEVSLLPTPALRSTALLLGYAALPWSVTSTSQFSFPWGWVWQEFKLGWKRPLAEVVGTVLFGPQLPDFLYAEAIAQLTLGEVGVEAYSALLGAAVGGYLPGGPVGGTVARVKAPLGGRSQLTLTVGFGASLPQEGFAIWHVSGLSRTYATDPRPGGAQFTQAEVSLTGLSLCCGVTHDLELSFTKAGFQHVEFTVRNLPLCCGIRLDAAVRFTVTAKQVSLTPHWEGVGTACLAVYGDVRYQNQAWEGIEIYGWKIRCEVAGCTYVELMTALANRGYFWLLPDGSVVHDDEPPFPASAEPLFYGDEFEYIRLGFCGPGCCGGKYTLDVVTYFVPTGALFGINRVTVGMTVPLSAGITFQAKVATPGTFVLGWTVAF